MKINVKRRMFNNASHNKAYSDNGLKGHSYVRRKINIKKATFLVLISIITIVSVVFLSVFIKNQLADAPDFNKLGNLWTLEDYSATYDYSLEILLDQPFNNSALAYHGYSAFYLALASTASEDVHRYIDEAINSLRIALLGARATVKPQIEYVLGKAYFHKNRLSAYYFYSDLAIKYLHSALNNGYNAIDIYEYLGLSYASLDMTRESISYFTEALLVNDSEVLRLAIAEQYYKLGNYSAAKPYLERIKKESNDQLYIIQCSNLLAQIYFDEGNYVESQNEYEYILQINENFADAHYGLGLIYEQQGDFVKARAKWREALEIEVNHQGARLKMK